jgi:mannosylglycoprotein endo-beta-mannosidase
MFEVGAISKGQFFISVQLLHRPSRSIFEAIGVYGPADHGRSRAFLEELSEKILHSTRPLVVGGDFNLLRSAADKNNSNLNWPLIDSFNEYIASWALQEIPRTGARYTWSNRQLNPVRSTLDRVFISQPFEVLFPLCSLSAETSLGSDHTPLVFDTGDESPPRSTRFFFETGWFERNDFFPLLNGAWEGLLSTARGRDIVDWWVHMSAGLRQILRGWSRNLGTEGRTEKATLLAQIEDLDRQADSVGIDDEGWALRYHLEEELLQIYQQEEEYWRQRGRVKWALKGDANTAYFHAVANGRRRKCAITALSTAEGIISEPRQVQEHIYSFYRELLGTTASRSCGLAPTTWAMEEQVTDAENEGLAITFTEVELESIVKDMKSDTAPGPDGFPVMFFKR